LEGYEVDPLKIQETKACQMFCTNTGHRADMNTYLCVAMKRTIMAFELTKTRQKHRKIRDIPVTGQVQFLDLWGDKLCVGYQSSFVIYNLLKEEAPISLVNTEDSQLQFLVHSSVDSMLAVEVSEKEYLLAFSGKLNYFLLIIFKIFIYVTQITVNYRYLNEILKVPIFFLLYLYWKYLFISIFLFRYFQYLDVKFQPQQLFSHYYPFCLSRLIVFFRLFPSDL
jgi:hypothetical protein